MEWKINLENGEHRLFEHINHLCILLDAIAIATTYLVDDKVQMGGSDYLALDCKNSKTMIKLPCFNPIPAALKGVVPDAIQISVETCAPPPQQYTHKTSGFKSVVMYAGTPIFVDFFESHKASIIEKFSNPPTKWPEIWNFGRVIRNSISHPGCLHFESQSHAPVRWKGLTYDPKMNGQKVIGEDISLGDLILLMLEMSDELDRHKVDRN